MHNILNFLEQMALDEYDRILYVLTAITVAMIIDFITGTWAAKVNSTIEYRSKEGINGILRKLASIIVLVFCIPLAPLIPAGTGIVALYVLYLGYLFLELTSIVENLNNIGVDVKFFKVFLNQVKGEDQKDEQPK